MKAGDDERMINYEWPHLILYFYLMSSDDAEMSSQQ